MIEKITDIIEAYHNIGRVIDQPGAIDNLPVALDQMEAALGAIDTDRLKSAGNGFVMSMAYYHRTACDVMACFERTPALLLERMKQHHIIYRADIIEAEETVAPMMEPCCVGGLEVAGSQCT